MTTKSTRKYLILVLALLTSVMSVGLVQNSIAAETGEQVFQKKMRGLPYHWRGEIGGA